MVYSIFSSKHSGTKSFSQNSRHFWIWLGDFCESRDGEQFRFDELFFELKKPQNPHTLSSLASEYRRGTEERMAAAAAYNGWEGGVRTHPHFISNTNPIKFDFLLSKQYQIWCQNPGNFKILQFDGCFGCVFWPKKAKKGWNFMDIVMQVWVCKSVRVCYTNVHTAQWRTPPHTAAAAAAAAAQQRRWKKENQTWRRIIVGGMGTEPPLYKEQKSRSVFVTPPHFTLSPACTRVGIFKICPKNMGCFSVRYLFPIGNCDFLIFWLKEW